MWLNKMRWRHLISDEYSWLMHTYYSHYIRLYHMLIHILRFAAFYLILLSCLGVRFYVDFIFFFFFSFFRLIKYSFNLLSLGICRFEHKYWPKKRTTNPKVKHTLRNTNITWNLKMSSRKVEKNAKISALFHMINILVAWLKWNWERTTTTADALRWWII